MINEARLDEAVDEEVFILDVVDGPFWFTVEGDFELDPLDWFISWVHIKGSEWFDYTVGPKDGLLDYVIELKTLDPRLLDELLNTTVSEWKWS